MRNAKVIVGIVLSLAGVVSAAEGEAPKTTKMIGGVYAVINKAWASRNLPNIMQVMGKDLAVVMQGQSEPRVFNHETFGAMFARVDLDKIGVASHKVRLVGSIRQGDLAFCGTQTEHRMRDGKSTSYTTLYVLHHTDKGWRIVLAFPAFISSALRVEKCLPKGAAGQAGLRAGDVLVRYDDKAIGGMPDIRAAVRASRGKADVPVVIRRAGREMTLRMKTGPTGTRWRHVLSAGQGATMQGAEVQAVRKAIEAHMDAVRRRDLKAFESRLSQKAYVDATTQDKTARILGREALLAETRKAFESKDIPWETLRTTDVRVIAKGPIALLQIDLSMGKAPNGPTSVSFLALMVKQDGKWLVVAGLSSLVDIAAKPAANAKQ